MGRVLPLGPPPVRRTTSRSSTRGSRSPRSPASTERIRLGPLVTPLPRRRPWKVARESVTLDHLSAGRLVLGVGLGIDHWREFAGFGGEAADDRRARRAARRRHRDHRPTVVGRAGDAIAARDSRSTTCASCPRPAQAPRIPIWSAVLWPPRPGPVRRAARCDGVVPFRPDGPLTPEQRPRAARRDQRPARAPISARSTCACTAAQELAAEFAAAGVTWFMESCYPEQPLAEVRRIIDAGPPRA